MTFTRQVAASGVQAGTIQASEELKFTDKGSWDLTGALVYHWDFGDGTYGEGWQTTKQYTAVGTYHVTLNVTNPFGVSATVEKDITVEAANPVTASGFPNVAIMASLVLVAAVALACGIYAFQRPRGQKPPPGSP